MLKILLLLGVIFYLFSELGKKDKKDSRKNSSRLKAQTKKNSKNIMDFDKGEYVDYKEVKS